MIFYVAVVTFFLFLGVNGSFAPLKISKVLVLGGSGRVGSQVVSRLLNQGIETNVLVRDIDKARSNPLLTGANLLAGDVNNIDDLAKGCESCQAVIAVHGMKPPRFSKIADLFLSKTRDANHPYNVNYLSIKKLLVVMEQQKINKLVRITGALVGQNPFNIFLFIFNIILSFTVKWQEIAEIAIRKSGIDYTIIRPPGIRDSPSIEEQNQNLNADRKVSIKKELYLYDEITKNNFKPGPSVISKHDLADLCVLSIRNPQLSNVTAIVGSRNGNGYTNWQSLLQNTKVHSDLSHGSPRRHYLAGAFYLSLLFITINYVPMGLRKLSQILNAKYRWKRFAIPFRL